MMRRTPTLKTNAAIAAIFVSALSVASQAAAGDGYRDTLIDAYADEFPDVRDRFDGVGTHAGSFWVLPSVETGFIYDSNVYALPRNPVDDTAFYIRPTVAVKSDFTRHALAFAAGLEHYEYFDQKSESRTNGWGNLQGRIDILRDANFLYGIRGGVFHEDRGEFNTPFFAKNPVQYGEAEAWGSLNKTFNRVSVSIGGRAKRLDYQNAVSALTGMTINQNFRDANYYEAGGRLGYLAAPGYRVFGDVRYKKTDYDQGVYDSDGVRALGGVEFDITHLLRGEVGIGYDYIDYDNPDFRKESGPTYNIALIWNPTPLMTLRLDGRKEFVDSTQRDLNGDLISGSDESSIKATLDYEVLRRLIISPEIGFIHNDYNDTSLKDNTFAAGVRLDYEVNRYIDLGLNYLYTDRDFSGKLLDYDRHRVGLFAKARF